MDFFTDTAKLTLKDPPQLVWVAVQTAVRLLWRENPKLHNQKEIASSIRRYGFQEPAKFDAKLFRIGQPPSDTEPLGAIKAGNGRIETVAWLETNWDSVQNDEEEIPRGLGVDANGTWVVPMIIGTDARSTSAAQEYAIDSNNITMSGGDMGGFDLARLWGPDYTDLLESLDELPVSVSVNDLDLLTSMWNTPDLDDLIEEHGEPGEQDFWPVIRVKVSPETRDLYNSLMRQAPGQDETTKFGHLIEAVDASALGGVVSDSLIT